MQRKKMTTPGVCPWCQNAVNAGAAVCASCGASELDGWKSLGARRHFVWALTFLFLISPGLFVIPFYPAWGVLLIAAGIAGPIALQRMLRGNHHWIAPGDRIRV